MMSEQRKKSPEPGSPSLGPLHNHRACLVGFATKGPVAVPTSVSSVQQLYHFFGTSSPELPLVLVAEQILAFESPVLVLRIAEPDAKAARVNVPCSSSQIVRAGAQGPYRLTKNSFFRWACDGATSPKILVALQGDYTAQELATHFNEQVARDRIYFYDDGGSLAIRCTGQMELAGVQDSMYEVLGLGNLVMPAELMSEPAESVELLDAHNLLVVVTGTGNLTVDNITQTISFKSLVGRRCSLIEVSNCINSQLAKNLPGGFQSLVRGGRLVLRSLHAGANVSLTIKGASTARGALGLNRLTAQGRCQELPDLENPGTCFTINSESPGTTGNGIRVQVETNHDDSFNLKVFHDDGLVESWSNLTKNPRDKFYVESFLGLISHWIRIADNTATTRPPRAGTYQVGVQGEGTDGVPASEQRRRELAREGLGTLGDEHDIDLIALPGETSPAVLDDLTAFCEERGDCLAVIDTPRGLAYGDALRWSRQLNASGCATAFWPWVKVWDAGNRREEAIPPCGSVIAALTRCDSVSCVWNSPTGMNRGIVPGVLDLAQRPKFLDRGGPKTETELNTIATKDGQFFIHEEATLNGGKISLKRLVFLLKKLIHRGIDSLLRDCIVTDDNFTENFIRICDQTLTQVRHRQGIQHYHIKAGDEINTPEVRAKGGFRAQIGVQPSHTSLWVSFDFSLNAGVANKTLFQRIGEAKWRYLL